MARETHSIAVRGAGVVGLWQALMLARSGHAVTLFEQSPQPFSEACSLYAGAMLAPRCEEESAEPVIRDLGKRGIALWREIYPCLLYTSDAADDLLCVDLGGRRIIKKKT